MRASGEVILRVEKVSTVYEGERRPAIRDVSLTVSAGELVCILGPNGAGKTTLLETVNGLLPCAKGRVEVFGMDPRKEGRRVRSRVGYVPQDFMVGPGEPFTALDVVLMGRYGRLGPLARPTEEDVERAREAMRLLGIEDLAQRPVGKLSGGQQQKVMIARALAKEPDMLLLDEPFSSLDRESRGLVVSIVKRMSERGLAALVVTHEPGPIIDACHRVVFMAEGRVAMDVPAGEAGPLLELCAFAQRALAGRWRWSP